MTISAGSAAIQMQARKLTSSDAVGTGGSVATSPDTIVACAPGRGPLGSSSAHPSGVRMHFRSRRSDHARSATTPALR
jgi:hypothetical protein